MDLDDKVYVIICVTALLALSMFIVPSSEIGEILKLGLAGLFGMAVGKSASDIQHRNKKPERDDENEDREDEITNVKRGGAKVQEPKEKGQL